MRKRAALMTGLVVSTLFVGCASSESIPEGWMSYENTEAGYRLAHPADWTEQELPNMTVLASPDNVLNITIAVQEPPDQNMDLAAYTAYYLDAVGPVMESQSLTFTLLSSEAVTFAGEPGHRMVFTLVGSNRARGVSLWTIHDDLVYTISVSAEEAEFGEGEEVMQTVIASMRFL